MAWPEESWEVLGTSGLFSVDYLVSTLREPLNAYRFVDEPPWLLYQLRFVEPSGGRQFGIAIEEVYRGPFEDRNPLATLGTMRLTAPVVGVLLATQAYSFAVGRAPVRVATRILVYANEMAFEGYVVEGGEPDMVIGCNQPDVVEALTALLRRSDCVVLADTTDDQTDGTSGHSVDVAALLKGTRRLTFKGRHLPVGPGGTFVHYLDVVDDGATVWERGNAPDREDPETNSEDFHEVVFKTDGDLAYYMVYSEGFVEYIELGRGHSDDVLVEMGESLSEAPDE